MEANVEVDPWG